MFLPFLTFRSMLRFSLNISSTACRSTHEISTRRSTACVAKIHLADERTRSIFIFAQSPFHERFVFWAMKQRTHLLQLLFCPHSQYIIWVVILVHDCFDLRFSIWYRQFNLLHHEAGMPAGAATLDRVPCRPWKSLDSKKWVGQPLQLSVKNWELISATFFSI